MSDQNKCTARWAVVGLMVLLVGCAQSEPDSTVYSEAHPPISWADYVANETELRAAAFERSRNINSYTRAAPPDIRGWSPVDLVASEALITAAIDLCTLSETETENLLNPIQYPEDAFAYELAMAERGILQAQVRLWRHCRASIADPHYPVTPETLLRLLQQAALTERGYAMGALAHCMFDIADAARMPHSSFELDKQLFWEARAMAQLDLGTLAAVELRRSSAPLYEEDTQERYLWRTLHYLAQVFSGSEGFARPMSQAERDAHLDFFVHFNHRSDEIDQTQVEATQQRVKEWLRQHPQAFALFDLPDRCRQAKGDWGNYDGVNQALARYGLRIKPPGMLLEGPQAVAP
ncbi:MAG: hypothetical protein LAT63_13795 [Marinobacter sp.]|nr:hypothetical protein [Marinobacter sp.]